jgi:hypothetical protein
LRLNKVFLNRFYIGKGPRLGVKIDHNATVKYATTMNAAWNFNVLGFGGKNISNTRENGG